MSCVDLWRERLGSILVSSTNICAEVCDVRMGAATRARSTGRGGWQQTVQSLSFWWVEKFTLIYLKALTAGK